MPIPFLVPLAIAAASATMATTGVVSGAKAIKKNKDAKHVNEDANQICKRAETHADMARAKTQKSLEDLGQRKLNVLNVSVNRFLNVFEQIHSIHVNESAGINELKNLHLDKQDIAEMQKMSLMAGSVLSGIAGGAGAGARAAFGAYGATMTFATASTGTAIASLSGAAATNATLAFLGGGALAAGGGGMALGSAVLGGALAGPAIAVLGIVMNASASKNLDNAYSNIAKAREYSEGCKTIETLCGAITARANMFSALVSKLDIVFMRLIERIEETVQTYGTDYSTYPEDAQSIVAMTLSVVTALKKVLDTPILDEAGNVTVESQNVHAEVTEFAKENNKIMNTSFPNAGDLFYSMPAVKNYMANLESSGVIKEIVRCSPPDALRLQIEGKLLEGNLTIGAHCKLEDSEEVYEVIEMGFDGKLTECQAGRSTHFTLRKV